MKMKMKYVFVVGILLALLMLASGVSAQFYNSADVGFSGSTNTYQSYQPTFDRLYSSGGDFVNSADMWPILRNMENDQCNATSDFIIGIPPGGCTPSVVRSDLLEEQNVPVFCQLYAIKVNPLIKVSSIRSISFPGPKPEGVSSVVFHPARAAVKSYTTLLGDPTLNNIGYVVIILKREKVEDNMEEWIAGSLSATIRYDAEEAYGTGASEYYLSLMSDEDWNTDYNANSFWSGRGFLRLESSGEGTARIQILSSKDNVIKTFNLKEGETSPITYLPGYYCRAGLKIKLDGIVAPEDKVLLNLDGDEFWLREGDRFYNDKCKISKLEIRTNNDGEVTVKCNGNKNIDLGLKGSGALFEVNGDSKEYLLGDFVYEGSLSSSSSNKWYLAYVGKMPKNYDKNQEEIAILLSGSKSLSSEDSASVYNSVNKLALEKDVKSENFLVDLQKLVKVSHEGTSLRAIEMGASSDGLKFISLGNKLADEDLKDSVAEEYFKKSTETTKELVEIYRSEEKENGDTYGEEALYEQIVLSGRVGKFATQVALMDLFIDKYSSSKIVENVRIKRQRLNGTDFSNSYTSVYVNDRFHTIGVVDFRNISEGERSVDLRIETQSHNGKAQGDIISHPDGELIIGKIIPGKVDITFKSKKDNIETKTITILEGGSEVFAGTEVYVRNVNVEEIAHVSIIPEVKHTTTEADFTFRIGIEKRGIELSPEKTKRMLKNLEEAIENWENIVERLGNVVKGMKGVCFATSTFLMLKNMATGFSGEAAARQRVMEEYKAICDSNYGTMTHTECYNHLSVQIEGNVTAMTAALKAVNTKMETAQTGNTGNSGGLFGGTGITDQEKYKADLRAQVIAGGTTEVEVDLGGGKKQKVPVSKLDSVSQIQAVILHQELGGKGVVGDGKSQLDQSLRNTALSYQQEQDREEASERIKSLVGTDKVNVQSIISADTDVLRTYGTKAKDYDIKITSLGVDGNSNVEFVNKDGQDYMVVLNEGIGNNMRGVEATYKLIDSGWVKQSTNLRAVFVTAGAPGECTNPWPAGKATVSYYESGNNKGLPAIVPFILREGWYVMVPNSGGTFLDNSPQGYTASADVKYFKICNIGTDRVMQSGQGDDLCQSFDANTVGSVKDFIPCPDKSAEEVQKLYSCAREAIRQASAQAGKSNININVCNEQKVMDRGQPMSQVGGFECQDFMSPEDCLLMFNVCDPVICPPSRCDLGGKMPVADVIQTGIIGSLVLCLPNAKEGIIFPICLSGIHAGLDAYVSILRSEQECLERSLETGEHVGICDQITSIYKCEFFWRQLSPVMNQLIPAFVQGLISPGQRVRGGGEYALVQQSWNSMQQSISYFKDVYAQNAFRAFNIRSSEEVGSEICKAFIGTSVPGGADLIDSLLEPESPSQFYAQFSEMTFTEATVPATSQYKVYYHIYAGNDVGAQYRVYLKNPPETSYYRSNPTIQVKSGYIAKGSSADETVDFIAPEGYKELCVVINAKEECGFKQVTTDFGLNYIQDKYVQEQAENENIKSEKECISGTPSALSMINLNVQAGAEDVINPAIAMSGIVRVCASANPAAGVDVGGDVECRENKDCGTGYTCGSNGICSYTRDGKVYNESAGTRWKEVGTCGGGLTCWLDTDSVKNDLKAIEAIEGTSISLLDGRRGLIDTGGLNLEQVQAILASARLRIKSLSSYDLQNPSTGNVPKILGELSNVTGTSTWEGDEEDKPGAGTNRDRAEAMALKASVYRMIVMELTKGLIVQGPHVATPPEISGVAVAKKTDDEIREGIASVECELEGGELDDFCSDECFIEGLDYYEDPDYDSVPDCCDIDCELEDENFWGDDEAPVEEEKVTWQDLKDAEFGKDLTQGQAIRLCNTCSYNTLVGDYQEDLQEFTISLNEIRMNYRAERDGGGKIIFGLIPTLL